MMGKGTWHSACVDENEQDEKCNAWMQDQDIRIPEHKHRSNNAWEPETQ